MALSDEERGRLEKLEQEMAAADSELNRILQSGLRRNKATARIVYGVLAAFAGFALVIAGINKQLTVIGAIGFLLMVAGAHLFPQRPRPTGQVRRADMTSRKHSHVGPLGQRFDGARRRATGQQPGAEMS